MSKASAPEVVRARHTGSLRLVLSLLSWVVCLGARASVVVLSAAQGEPAGPVAVLLEAGKPISGRMETGHSLQYGIWLAADQFVDVVIAFQGRPVEATLLRPSGESIVRSSRERLPDAEILFVADAPGLYRLEVRPEGESGSSVSYEVRIEALRAATGADRTCARAAAAFREGARLSETQSEDASRAALRQFEDSLALWKEAGDPKGEAAALTRIGATYNDLNQGEKALEFSNSALAIREALGDRAGQASVLNTIGFSHHALGEMSKALEAHSRALAFARELGKIEEEANALQNLGGIYGETGEPFRELEADAQALPLFRTLGSRTGEAATLHGMAIIYSQLGDRQRALDTEYEVLALVRAIGERRGEASALGSLGATYRDLGEPRRALELFRQQLDVARASGNRRSQTYALTHLGEAYLLLGDPGKALSQFTRALALSREFKNRSTEALTLQFLARLYDANGDRRKALQAYQESLALYRAVGDPTGEDRVLSAIGKLSAALGDLAGAGRAYSQALAVSRAARDPAASAEALDGLARLDRDRGDLDAARARLEESLGIFEEARARVGSADLRSTFQSSYRATSELYLDVLMRMARRDPSAGFEAQALEASERARARSLLELLAESGAGIGQGVDAALIDRENTLRGRITAKAQLRMRLPSVEAGVAQAAAFDKEIDTLSSELEQVQAQIRVLSPRYAALTRPAPLTARAIQQLLDDETLLLEYWLGEERSFLWIVGPGSLTVTELPARARIDAAARAAYVELTRPAAGAAPVRRMAARLSAMVLGPLLSQPSRKRLLVVADGALQLIPFPALPAPGGKAPLIVEHEVVSLPSASLLPVLRAQSDDRVPATKVLAVLADPVFDRRDARVRAAGSKSASGKASGSARPGAAPERALIRSIRDLAPGAELTLPRLPFTRHEALGILALAPASESKGALDFAASLATATSDDLSHYRYVHFATHGLLNEVHPELSGLVLSLVGPEGADQDGFLPATEVFKLKLSADLVVLSACRTALGKQIRGEGLVGLTRAFMYAGTPRVLASLWRVDDAATAELMKRFYQGMLGPKKLRPAAALREAQLAVRQQKRWKHPYYWAGFILRGEWR